MGKGVGEVHDCFNGGAEIGKTIYPAMGRSKGNAPSQVPWARLLQVGGCHCCVGAPNKSHQQGQD